MNELELYEKIDWPVFTNCYRNELFFEKTFETFPFEPNLKSITAIHQSFDQLDSLIFDSCPEFILLPMNIDFSSLFLRLDKSATLNFIELSKVLHLIQCFQGIFRALNTVAHFKAQTLEPRLIQSFVKPLASILDINGELIEEKCPELFAINKELEQVHQMALHKLQNILSSHQWQKRMQMRQYDIIHGHYVIPIKSTMYQGQLGAIIDRSESGGTFYVTPLTLMDLNRKRILIINKKAKILEKMQQEFSMLAQPYTPLFEQLWYQLQFLDQLKAKKRLVHRWNLHRCTMVENANHYNNIDITALMHPLMENGVSNDVCIPAIYKGMAICGPNMGGKTVILKSILLCHLFPLCGLFIPALRAKIRLFTKFYFLASIQQDIIKGLSSFGMEIYYYLSLAHGNLKNSFIVMDEIFNTTSSEDAAPIAYAFIEYFLQQENNLCLISTHHEQLKLKLLESPLVQSASMHIDPITNRPTFKLQLGVLGKSMAISTLSFIEEKYFSSQFMTYKATHHTPQEIIQMQSQIKTLLELQAQIEKEKSQWSLDVLATQMEILEEKENILQAFKKECENQSIKQIQNNIAKNQRHKEQLNFLMKNAKTETYTKIESVDIGKVYYMLSIKNNVEVIKIHKDTILVKTIGKNAIRIKTTLGDLFLKK